MADYKISVQFRENLSTNMTYLKKRNDCYVERVFPIYVLDNENSYASRDCWLTRGKYTCLGGR